MNLLDLVILAAAVYAAINGFRRGAILQIATYTGLLGGLLAGAVLAPKLAGFIDDPVPQAFVALVLLLALAALGDAVGWLVGRAVWTVTRASPLAVFDSAGGSVVSVIALLLAVWFVGLNLSSGPIPELSRAINESAVIRTLDSALPRPPSILAQIRGLLNRFGFPEVFADLPPAPAGPVEGPSGGAVEAAAQLADQSTLRVVGEACGMIQEGSGFIASSNLVVTNAHVVAGVQSPRVQQQNGPSQTAVTVAFDPDLDIAVLRVEEAPAPPLEIVGNEVERGVGGAVLGYPGGGGLTFGAAAVMRSMAPVGRDIYGRDLIQREVYELQAIVRPGNSGGPFVLLDGRVAGVVFAASTTHRDVGYAITSPKVLPVLQAARDRSEAVSTGPCIR